MCELHDYSPDGLHDAPGGHRACARCLADHFVRCSDCGSVEEEQSNHAVEIELSEMYGFTVEEDDGLCKKHLSRAYAEGWRDENPQASGPPPGLQARLRIAGF